MLPGTGHFPSLRITHLQDIERPRLDNTPMLSGWGSDISAQMLRALKVKYVTLNPGASYRGLHDSLVNFLGNETPQMLLCLNEDHVISIAHGYAKATDEPMACVLHSNVGLMHGLMGIYNAWCDRAPMLVVGATGPVATDKRRPWIDWIHTAKDQGALLRDFTKWDDEPRSAAAIPESFLRGMQLTRTLPSAPVYICLDAGLQEEKLTSAVAIPDVSRFAPPAPPSADAATIEKVADLLLGAKNPVLLMGRGSRKQEDWDRRVALAELVGAPVFTSIRERAIFPTDHPLHAVPPSQWLSPRGKEIIKAADVIVSLDWIDLNGTLLQVMRDTHRIPAKIVHASLDSSLHRGWSADHFGLPPVDVPVTTSPDTFVAQLLPVIRARLGGKTRPAAAKQQAAPVAYSEKADTEIAPRDIEVALAKLRGDQNFTLGHITIGWSGEAYHFTGPLDYLGHDGGGGLAAGPGLTIGAALALKESGRTVIAVLGDGDFLQGVTALWTAAHYGIPALFIVSNNKSNFNDELHQEAVAKMRGRPPENRWIGQRMDDPTIDLATMARGQGVEAEGPIKTVPELENAIRRGLAAVAAGRPYLIDAHVNPGYAGPPLARGE
jgi:thiamine pyrophosphate-dependent acetolactate synthase large subunit-like protein